ncbi:hypothetical protein [Pedobacter sp. Hv1]|uniref:hypothetical protein n=1 Tax=Pedobacter sp. Hv1 TaxID=1740090 RepID=UPI0006D8AA96|nr:hypothetical protein [Pedobacter sp. Hv1]KQC01563.1 hypothetical protein AQF98_07610 [Pedobacter sp. Hv1]
MSRTKYGFFAFILLFFWGLNLKAQQELTVNAVVFEKNSKIRLTDATVFNKRNKYVAFSNSMGLFNIKAAVGDTLLITKLYYDDVVVTVGLVKDMVIYLKKNTNMLDEIVVNKTRVIDEIKKDYKNGAVPTGKVSLLSFLSPLSAIYGLTSRDGQNARRFSRYYNNELKESHVDTFFNKSLVTSNTGLTGKELDNFMFNYRPDYEKSKNWTQYDGVKWIKDSYKKYLDTAKKAN